MTDLGSVSILNIAIHQAVECWYTPTVHTCNRVISRFHNSPVNNKPQQEAPGNKLQCLWGIFPEDSDWVLLFIAEYQNIKIDLLQKQNFFQKVHSIFFNILVLITNDDTINAHQIFQTGHQFWFLFVFLASWPFSYNNKHSISTMLGNQSICANFIHRSIPWYVSTRVEFFLYLWINNYTHNAAALCFHKTENSNAYYKVTGKYSLVQGFICHDF